MRSAHRVASSAPPPGHARPQQHARRSTGAASKLAGPHRAVQAAGGGCGRPLRPPSLRCCVCALATPRNLARCSQLLCPVSRASLAPSPPPRNLCCSITPGVSQIGWGRSWGRQLPLLCMHAARCAAARQPAAGCRCRLAPAAVALGAEATHIHSQAAHYFIVLYSQYLLVYYAGVMKVLEQLGIVKPGETSCMV